MELDVLIVGAGPAGLACAIELARVAQREHTDVNIGVLEKAEALGEHCLSGAVVNPRAREAVRSEEHTSELQSRSDLVCRLLLEKKKNKNAKQNCETHP